MYAALADEIRTINTQLRSPIDCRFPQYPTPATETLIPFLDIEVARAQPTCRSRGMCFAKRRACSVLKSFFISPPPPAAAGGTSFIPAKRPRRFLPLYPVGISVRWQWICRKGSPPVNTTAETTPWIARRRFLCMTMIPSSCCAVFQNPSFYHGHTTVDDPATRAGHWCCPGPPPALASSPLCQQRPCTPAHGVSRPAIIPPSSHSDVYQRDGCPADRRRGPSAGRNRGLRERAKAKLPARALLRGVSRHRRPSPLPSERDSSCCLFAGRCCRQPT